MTKTQRAKIQTATDRVAVAYSRLKQAKRTKGRTKIRKAEREYDKAREACQMEAR